MTATAEGTLHADLVAGLGALAEIGADESADTGQYVYRYASLAAVMRAVRPVLAKHRLAVSQLVSSADRELCVTTVLVHASGAMHQSGAMRVQLPDTAQRIGSAVSYLRRYQLVALLGIAVDDDDGRSASTHTSAQAPAARVALTEAQRRRIMALFGELGMTGPEYRDERLALTSDVIGRDIDTTNDVTRGEAAQLIDELEARVQRVHEGGHG